jgi:hypothetical protein
VKWQMAEGREGTSGETIRHSYMSFAGVIVMSASIVPHKIFIAEIFSGGCMMFDNSIQFGTK